MLSSGHLVSGLDASPATFALAMFLGGAALAVFAVLVIYLIRRAGLAGIVGVLGGAGLVLVGAMLAAVLLDRQLIHDQAADRRAIELRSAELTARAIAPGSALACLDGVTSVLVENACEKALFASPEAVASAVAYVDARFSLLAASSALAERDRTYQPSLERLRQSLGQDRFGLVAHVLAARGCGSADCAELALLQDSDRVIANMKAKLFESQVGVHALAWHQSGPAAAASTAPASPMPPSTMTGLSPAPPTTVGGPPPGKFDFPSAASIPPVSIMNAEPGSPPSTEAKPPAASGPKRPPARHQAAKPPVHAAASAPAPPPAPPLDTAPPTPPSPPPQAAPPEPPQTPRAVDRPPE